MMAYTKPGLRDRIKAAVMRGSEGGKAGQWSARKAQLVAQRYEKAGGGYSGGKTKEQESLSKWTKQKWRTKSGKKSLVTGERYLPEKAIKKLSPSEYARTSAAKREGMAKGKQFVRQPKSIAEKVKQFRK
jgi:hypothetical protein